MYSKITREKYRKSQNIHTKFCNFPYFNLVILEYMNSCKPYLHLGVESISSQF